MQTSIVMAAPRCMVNVYSSVWDGPQPGVVTDVPAKKEIPGLDGESQVVTVNVFIDAAKHFWVVLVLLARQHGGTFSGVPLFDPLSDAQRQTLKANGPKVEMLSTWQVPMWAEWPLRT